MSLIVNERPSELNLGYIDQILRKIDEIENIQNKNNNGANGYYLHTGFVYLEDKIKSESKKSNFSYVSEPTVIESEKHSFYTNNRLDSSDSYDSVDKHRVKNPRELVTSFTVKKNFYKNPENNQRARMGSPGTISMTGSEDKKTDAFASSEKLIIPEIILPMTADQKIEIKDDDNETYEKETDLNKEEPIEREEPQMPEKIKFPLNRKEEFHQANSTKSQPKPLLKPVGSRNLSNENRLKRLLNKFNPLKIKLKRDKKYSRK